jgi:hypothetical protein
VANFTPIDLKTYVWYDTSPSEPTFVGESDNSLYKDLSLELRDTTIWKIDPETIEQVDLHTGDYSIQLQRRGEKWRSATDPFLKIDNQKVMDYLESIRETRVRKFVSHTPLTDEDKVTFRLVEPWYTFKLTDTDGKEVEVTVSRSGGITEQTAGRYATSPGITGVFVISAEAAGKITRKIKDFAAE